MSIGQQQSYEVIKKMRSVITLAAPQSISPITMRDYLGIYNRFHDKSLSEKNVTNKSILQLATETTSKNTWYKRRASIKFSYVANLVSLLKKQDNMQKESKDPLITENTRLQIQQKWLDEVSKAQYWLDMLDALPQECPIPTELRKKRVSKRQHMKNLDDDWRQQIIANANPEWKLSILVLAVTGCRPEELKRGIHFKIINNQLVCTINSAKVKDGKIAARVKDDAGNLIKKIVNYHAGQETRELHFDLGQYPLVDMLAKAIGSGATVTIENKSSLTSTVRAVAKKLWPARKKSITSYCFRHVLASDMKSSGMLDDDISTALGHAASATKSFYGQAQMSRDGHIPANVIGTRPVKQSKRVRPTKKTGMKP